MVVALNPVEADADGSVVVGEQGAVIVGGERVVLGLQVIPFAVKLVEQEGRLIFFRPGWADLVVGVMGISGRLLR